MSAFVLDASYSLTWCFPDRATPNTDATLKRMEGRIDRAIVPGIWPLEIANALGKGVSRSKLSLQRALDIRKELLSLLIRHVATDNVPQLMQLAVKHNMSIYDTCYLQAAPVSNLPLATNDRKLKQVAEENGLATLTP